MKVKHNFNLESSAKEGKGKTLTLFLNVSYGYTELHPVKQTKRYVPMRMSTGFTLKADEWDKVKSRPKVTYRFRHLLVVRMNELVKLAEEILAEYAYKNNNRKPHPHALRKMIKDKCKSY